MIKHFIININPIYLWSNVMYFVFLNVMNVIFFHVFFLAHGDEVFLLTFNVTVISNYSCKI
jgi:hypothetical protein